MYRMLIVDDEPYIVEGLKELFEEAEEPELDIYCAHSAMEALARLEQTRIDIVLSDIRMPGMSGLVLLQHIRSRWPACKVIFLSGHNEFSYVQEAIRHGSAGYLLKADDEEDILKTVMKVIDELAGDQQMQILIDKAKEQMHKALPVLQKNYLIVQTGGEASGSPNRQKQFEELELPLEANRKLTLVVGRVDHWGDGFTPMDKELLLYAVQNIAYEVISHAAVTVPVVYDRSRFFWIIQEHEAQEEGENHSSRFVHESLDFIQSQCRLLLKLPVSLAATLEPFTWHELPEKYGHLNRLLIRGLGQGDEMLLYEEARNTCSDEEAGAGEHTREAAAHRRHAGLNQLSTLLESGNREQFGLLLSGIAERTAGRPYGEIQETYYTVATMILTQINRWDVYEEVAAQLPMNALLSLNSHVSWLEAGRFLQQAAEILFGLLEKDKSDKSNEVVERLHRYIMSHIADDLSLARLADVVGLNSSYLCRLYKQLTGIGLSDYITDVKLAAAKSLLKESNLKISEVAARIGFDSGYFSRFFKKITLLTPQEYREKVAK